VINIIFVKVLASPIGSKKQAIMQGLKKKLGYFSSIQGDIDGMHFSISKHVRPFNEDYFYHKASRFV
jgi:hypothetical protein